MDILKFHVIFRCAYFKSIKCAMVSKMEMEKAIILDFHTRVW